MLGDEGSSYQDVYDGHELLDEGVEYIDEEGNSVYITNEFPMAVSTSIFYKYFFSKIILFTMPI